MTTNNAASLGTFSTATATYTGRVATTVAEVSANFGVVDIPADYGYTYGNYYTSRVNGQNVTRYMYTNRIQSVNTSNYRYALILHGNGNGSFVYLLVSVDAKLQATGVAGDGYYWGNYGGSGAPVAPTITGYNLYSNGFAQIRSVNTNNYAQMSNIFDGGVVRGTGSSGFGLLPFFGKWTFNATPIASGMRYRAYAPNGVEAASWDCTDPNLFSVEVNSTEAGFGLVSNGSYRPTLDNWVARDL